MCYNPDTWHNFPKRNSPVKNCTKEQNAKQKTNLKPKINLETIVPVSIENNLASKNTTKVFRRVHLVLVTLMF